MSKRTTSTLRAARLAGCAAIIFACATTAHAACPPRGYDRPALLALKASGFEIARDRARNDLALALADCLGDRDPAIRDAIAYEAYFTWMRAGALRTSTLRTLDARLIGFLHEEDPEGFRRPFAALVLSEIARTDLSTPYLTNEERSALAAAAANYLANVRDYRGFDEREGWRHGVAHGADLVMQLARNPALSADDAARLRQAIAAQISPSDHFYIYGEPARLARPILFLARRGAFTPDDWSAWFASVAGPGPLQNWASAYASQTGLARRHNIEAFLNAIILSARADPTFAPLLPGAEAARAALP